jgi:uncharacterized protein YegP (UPF0339 family)
MRFEVYQGKGGRWYWRLVARNGKIIADGSQGYSESQNARRAVLNLKKRLRRDVPIESVRQAA